MCPSARFQRWKHVLGMNEASKGAQEYGEGLVSVGKHTQDTLAARSPMQYSLLDDNDYPFTQAYSRQYTDRHDDRPPHLTEMHVNFEQK